MLTCARPACKAKFEPTRQWQKFCSKACKNRHNGEARLEGLRLREENVALKARIKELEDGQM